MQSIDHEAASRSDVEVSQGEQQAHVQIWTALSRTEHQRLVEASAQHVVSFPNGVKARITIDPRLASSLIDKIIMLMTLGLIVHASAAGKLLLISGMVCPRSQ